MVRKKTKVSRKKCVSCTRPVGLLGSVMSWVKERAGVSKPCNCN
jgi:hypothetical protein